MSNAFDGTYMFIWQLKEVLKGDPDAIVAKVKELGVTGAIVKIANGSLKGDPVSQAFMDDFKRVAPKLKAAGIKVGGWIYQYMTDVQGEAEACFEAIDNGADFIVLDGEVELRGKNAEVKQFGEIFRAKYPNYPLALSSFAIANLHPEVPFAEYNQFVNFMMPQVYWGDMGWSVQGAFNTSVASYKKFGKPILVTGQAYAKATSTEMKQFVDLCKGAGITHLSWWDWQHANADQLNSVKANVIQAPKPVVVKDDPKMAKSKHFVDIPESMSWLVPFADDLFEKGILKGDGNGHLNPSDKATRAELVVLVGQVVKYLEKAGK